MRIYTISKRMTYALGIVVAMIVGGLTTTLASAAIPDSNGAIHGCYDGSGVLRIIDSSSQSCGGDTAVTWDKQGTGNLLPIQQGDRVSSVQLTYRDLSNLNATNVIFANNNFTGSKLTNINLTGAEFSNPYGDRVDFSGVDFSSVQAFITPGFTRSNFSNTNWTNMNLDGCSFGQFTINEAANLTGADFSGTTLGCADFRQSNLSNINFSGATLTAVNLQDTTMTGANITNTTWSNVTCPDGTNSNDNGNTCADHFGN